MSAPVGAVAPVDIAQAPPDAWAAGPLSSRGPGQGFSDLFTQFIDHVDQQVDQANLEVRKLALGEEGNLHQVMIALEDARMSLSLMVQVRNRVVEAYQDLMRMQI